MNRMALEGCRCRQIFQTVMCRLERGMKGPPDSYSDEEKDYYRKTEAGILQDREDGLVVNYSFPDSYD